MPRIDSFLAELEHEAALTRRLLERVPEERLEFKPHERSMTLGRLAGHVAEMPLWGTMTLTTDELDLAARTDLESFTARDRAGLLARFDREVEAFREAARGRDDDELRAAWRLRQGDRVFFEMPRAAVLRTWVLNHLVHHRGQLTVYLRLLDVPLPAIYGPSADEEPGPPG